MAIHNELGRWGESIAAEYLERKGYAIVERDWHSGHRDIDIIARDGMETVFVEVKTRRNDNFIEPEMAVDWKKQQSLRLSINHYVKWNRVVRFRLDVITVTGTPEQGAPRINHIQDFQLAMR